MSSTVTSASAVSSGSQTASPSSTDGPSGLWQSEAFKYGVLLLFVAILVSSFMCSFAIRRRATAALRMDAFGYREEFARKVKKIPKVPPKMSEVYLEKDIAEGYMNSIVRTS
jgi:hypothetical protein